MAVYGIPLVAALALMSVLGGSQHNDEARSAEKLTYGVPRSDTGGRRIG